MAKDPIVNAILRGVYFKDEPVNLDKGKYTNRLTLLKVPRLTKERILRVSPEINLITSKDNQINAAENLTNGFIGSEHLYNQLTIRAHRKAGSSSWFDVNVRLMTLDGGDVIYENNLTFFGEEQTKTITFPATHDIFLEIVNNGTSYVYVDYTFKYSEVINPNIVKLYGKLDDNTAITRYLKNTLELFNKAIIEFTNTGTLDLVITVSTFNTFLASETLFTETITAGASYHKAISFDDCDSIKLVLDNNHLTLDLYFNILLFFSKNLKPELDEHIADSTIHFTHTHLHEYGTYTGNGTSNRVIGGSLWQSKLIMIIDNRSGYGWWIKTQQIAGKYAKISHDSLNYNNVVELFNNDTQFKVSGFANTNGIIYTYIRFVSPP